MSTSCNTYLTCNEAIYLGCFSHCCYRKIPLTANVTGTYDFEYKRSGVTQKFEIFAMAGNQFNLNMNILPANEEIVLEITDPNGDKYMAEDINGVYTYCTTGDNCRELFILKTEITYFNEEGITTEDLTFASLIEDNLTKP